MEAVDFHALTPVQERRLVTYIEDHSLDIMRAFQKRHMSSSKLRTLPDYINATRSLVFDIIMSIPPLVPSGELRVSMLLRLTSDLFEAIPAYPAFIAPVGAPGTGTEDDEDEDDLLSSSGGSAGSESIGPRPTRYPLVDLFDLLYDLDNAWGAVLSCQVWDYESKKGEDVILSIADDEADNAQDSQTEGNGMDLDKASASSVKGDDPSIQLYAPTKTDCTRLRSMIVTGMSAIEDWLDEANAPDAAKQPFENCFDLTLRLLGDDSNEATWAPDEFVSCGAK